MRRTRLLRWTAVIILLPVVLNSCGFTLRGGNSISSSFSGLALDLDQPNSEFSRLLRRSLQVAGVDTSLSASSPDSAVLRVSNERLVNRAVTVNPRARAAQYELRLSVDIAIERANASILAPQTLTVERTYFEDIANIAGTRDEVEIITNEMRRDLVDQLLRRLEATSNS